MVDVKKDFYKTLGVDQKADLKAIKNAYRRAAKRFHPDLSPRDEERFKELQEAYEALSDPLRRKDYDREMAERSWPADQHAATAREPPYGSFGHIEDLFSSPGSLWQGFGVGLFRLEVERPDQLRLEVILTPEEAETGGDLPLNIPTMVRCGRCRGRGEIGGLICGRCRGEGHEKLIKRTSLSIPPGVRDRTQKMVHLNFPDGGRIDILVTIKVRL
jgi:molecular chaperone DnaJ